LFLRSDELLLLVHGYNNSEPVAFASYRKFMANIGSVWSSRTSAVFWPGDGWTRDPAAHEGWRSVVLSAASYP